MTTVVSTPPIQFEESSVGSVRVLQAGQGEPLVVLPGTDGLRLTRGYELLAGMCQVIALDAPADRVPEVIQHLGVERVTLLAAAESAATAVQLCLQQPEVVRALIIESPTPAVDEQLASVSQPTLIVCGTRDSARWQYREMIPRCHFIMVYDAGRAPSQDRPEAFAEVVGDYIQRLEAFVVQRDSGMVFR